MMDLDFFKVVNDGHGHPAGDQVLVETAVFLMEHLRAYDKVFRYGGEEFLICLPNMDAAVSMGVVERLRNELAQKAFSLADGANIKVTASFGVAELDPTCRWRRHWTSPTRRFMRPRAPAGIARGRGIPRCERSRLAIFSQALGIGKTTVPESPPA